MRKILIPSLNSLPKNKILDGSRFITLANKINVARNLKNVLEKGRKHFGKRRKCWLPAFSPKCFQNSSIRVAKSQDCVVKRLCKCQV